ncbi:MAG TPA: hypothetical protein VI168_12665 [Croceibacterium sp.]
MREFTASRAPFSKLVLIFAVLGFCSALVAQTPDGITLDEDSITLRFPASRAGTELDFYAINLGHIGVYTVGPDGIIRLDLSRVAPKQNVCFFAADRRGNRLVNLTRQKGFRNPFWEQRPLARGPVTTRAVVDIQNDLNSFKAQLSDAERTLKDGADGRFRGGRCQRNPIEARERPAFGLGGQFADIYGAVRCAPVISSRPLSCATVLQNASLAETSAFTAATCSARLADVQRLVASNRDRDDAVAHNAIADRARAQLSSDADRRAEVAGQCIRDVHQASESLLTRWQNETNTAEETEDDALARCNRNLQISADGPARLDELQAELASASARDAAAARNGPGGASRDGASYPCTPNAGA